MKRFLNITLLSIFTFLITLNSCSSSKSNKELLIGSWKIDNLSFSNGMNIKNRKAYEEMLESFKESGRFIFNSDMTYEGKFDGAVLQSGTWTLNEETDVIYMKSSQPESASILHDTVHIDSVDENEMSLSLKEENSTITAHFVRIK